MKEKHPGKSLGSKSRLGTMNGDRWRRLHELLSRANRIVCSTHENPDGDGLGSQLAMSHYLNEQGKECRILNPSPLPEEYSFLRKFSQFEQYDPRKHKDWVHKADLALVFDIGDYDRLNQLGKDLKTYGITTFSIDHHPHRRLNGFAYTVHDVSACATGFLVWEYLNCVQNLNARQPRLNKRNLPSASTSSHPEIIYGLYVALMTDTGSFRFSNTSAEAHEMASDLISRGIKPYEIYQKVYERNTVGRLRLLGSALKDVHLDGDKDLAWFEVTQKMVKQAGAKSEDLSGFTDVIRSIRGIKVALTIFEISEKECRVNFRSKGEIKIHRLAKRLGGGGHPFAAGATLNMSLKDAVEYLVTETLKEIRHQKRSRLAVRRAMSSKSKG